MKKFLLILTLFTTITLNTYAQFGRGCNVEKRDTTLTQKRVFPRSILPASYSLKKYAPPVLSQGNLSSCTAWSSAYCGLTICKRIETSNMSSQPFSPLHLYNRLKAKDSEDPCYAGGCYVSEALTMLQDHGCARFNDVANSCGYASASDDYDDKLYAYDEVGVNANDIKSALTRNSPVVMVIQYYKDGWGEKANLPNGVWNGAYSQADGYHAMCIIGYDDNVGEAGSFLVQNSWGDDWGKEGYFWLQYKDLWHVNQTFMLVANPNGSSDNTNNNSYSDNNTNNNNDNNNSNDNNNTNDTNNYNDDPDNNYNNVDNNPTDQVFRVYNECSVTAYVALSQYEAGSWVNRGWYATQPGEYVDLQIGSRKYEDIYWLALNNANNLLWYDSENGTDMCYDPTDAFTIYDNANPNCPQYVKWFKETPGYDGQVYSQTLTCPSIKSRGSDQVIYTPKVKNEKHDNRPPADANYDWKEGYELMDLYSKSIIHPVKETYTIWYIDETDQSVRSANLSSSRLANLKAYKFATKENVERWMNLNKK